MNEPPDSQPPDSPPDSQPSDSRPRQSRPLSETDASGDPFEQFALWYGDASAVVRVPEAAAVATADASGRPSVRMVLVKRWDEAGFVFHSNYASRKGQEIESNPRAAILFHWDELGRQVRIEGAVAPVSDDESDGYFATRPFGAQLGAIASQQSQPVASREELDTRVRSLAAEYAGRQVPRPQTWGGYRVAAEVFEFWQNRDDRLHDRLQYKREGGGWERVRLQP